MPKAKAAPAAKRAPKAHKLAETFPKGEILKDTRKKEWRLGEVIGQGGFGLIYKASDDISKAVSPDAPFVIKIEPIDNGPLFCELHFYQRIAKPESIDEWVKKKKLKYLPVPKLCGAGTHERNTKTYRFLAIPRFSTDLQKLFESNGKSFSAKTVYGIGLRMIDALEYLHENDYVHADIKAANILLGFENGNTINDKVYLVDFGLASKYVINGKHKEYKEDPKKAHDGTVEFTSRDSHNGVSPSRRADFEILGYCLLQWLCGVLPWEDKLNNKEYVKDCKIKYMKDVPSLMKKCFPDGNPPDPITTFLSLVSKLKYEDKPNYNKFKDVLIQGLKKAGEKDEWKLNISIDGSSTSGSKKTPKKKTAGLSPKKNTKKQKSDSSDSDLLKSPVKQKTNSPVKKTAESPVKKKVKKTSKSPVKKAVSSPVPKKEPSSLTPAQRHILSKMNGGSKPVAAKVKKSTPVKAKVVESPVIVQEDSDSDISSSDEENNYNGTSRSISATKSKKSAKSPSPVRQLRKASKRNYVEDSMSMEEDEVEFSEDDEPTPKKSRGSTPSKRICQSTEDISPTAKGSASKKGTKRLVRRKRNAAQVDASSQTSPAVSVKKKR